ncbi:MAG TPA: xanthine dehydrogenase family protein subunit M [Anaerolineae bacterium]
MKPAPFKYYAPGSLPEALALMAEHGDDAKVLAGGQSLTPMMNFRLVRPSILVDLNRIAELSYVREQAGGLAIGAMTRQRQAERDPMIAKRAPLISETMPFVAHPQIRNRGTMGGICAHADPAAELPAVALALELEFKAASIRGERTVPAADFFIGLFSTALAPDELLTEIIVPPLPARTGYAFQEVSRRHGDFALAGVACALTLDNAGVCTKTHLVFLGLGMQPIDARAAAKHLVGNKPTADAIRAASESVDAEIDPSADIHASVEYRRQLARVLARRVLEMAAEKANRH